MIKLVITGYIIDKIFTTLFQGKTAQGDRRGPARKKGDQHRPSQADSQKSYGQLDEQ